jgi:Cu(I)/Ag(I) efflux system periplasmic protein CusF
MNSKFLLALLLSAGFAGAALAEDKPMDHGTMMDHGTKTGEPMMDHSTMGHGEQMGASEASGVGVLNSIDVEKGQINITHEPMPELGWPTMTMDMPVTRRVDLGALKPGDKVDFKVKLGRDKQYRVIEISPQK